MISSSDKWTLKSLTTEYDPRDLNWYLHAVYEVKSEWETKKIDIPRIRLPIAMYPVFEHLVGVPENEHTINLGFGELEIRPNANGNLYMVETIEERAEEVTMEDIEKKFGHKVKIVANPKLEDLL